MVIIQMKKYEYVEEVTFKKEGKKERTNQMTPTNFLENDFSNLKIWISLFYS